MVNVLVLGGHGKIALQITRLLAASGHTVTSVIRDASQTADILATAPSSHTGLIKPLVSSLEETDAETILQQLEGIDWVIWSAGMYILYYYIIYNTPPQIQFTCRGDP